MSDTTAVVAGNGPSLAEIPAGVVIKGDMIIRTNSFFLESTYHLGDQVDLAYVAGDPRVAPFVLATMQKVSDHYSIAGWSAQNPSVIKAGSKHVTRPFEPFATANPEASRTLKSLSERYQAQPTAGVTAMFQAQARGARTLILAGIDLYATSQRYVYEPGKHMRDLLGPNLGARAYDTRLHNESLDRALIDWMANQDGMTVLKASAASPLDGIDVAPVRSGEPVLPKPKAVSDEWVSWAGWYPIWWLKAMRKAAAWSRASGLRPS